MDPCDAQTQLPESSSFARSSSISRSTGGRTFNTSIDTNTWVESDNDLRGYKVIATDASLTGCATVCLTQDGRIEIHSLRNAQAKKQTTLWVTDNFVAAKAVAKGHSTTFLGDRLLTHLLASGAWPTAVIRYRQNASGQILCSAACISNI